MIVFVYRTNLVLFSLRLLFQGLVDYDGDSEEELDAAEDEDEGESAAPQQKKARLA